MGSQTVLHLGQFWEGKTVTYTATQLEALRESAKDDTAFQTILSVTQHSCLNLLLQNPYILAIVLDRQGQILDYSAGCVALSGCQAAEVIGTPVTHWLQADHLQRLLDQLPHTPLPLQFDAALLTPDGRQPMVRWVFDHTDHDSLILMGTDVSDYHTHVLDLHKREQRYRMVVEDQTEMICRYTPDFVLTFVNEAFCRYCSKPCSELLGQSFVPFIHPDDHYQALAHLATLTPQQPTATVEHRAVLPDGTVSWYQWVDRAIFDEQGQLIEYQAVGRDITDRKLAEQALRESECRFRQITENLDDTFFIRDVVNHKMLYISPKYEQIWGKSSNTLFDNVSQFQHLVHSDDRERVARAVSLTDMGIPIDEIYRTVWPDGSMRWTHVRSFPVTNEEGQVYRVVGFASDVTTRKRQEEEREQLILDLRAFGHTVAHDLKNPVNTILTSAEIVQQLTESQAEAQRFVGHILDKGRAIYRIINALMLLGGVRDAEFDTEALDMTLLVQRALQRLRLEIENRGAIIEIVAGGWHPILGYEPWVEEIWVNYVLNALQYGGSPPILRIGAETDPINPDHIRFYVHDNGHGLSPSEIARLFAPFTRLNERSTGHGLGLSIVKRIIEKLGGRVGVVSEVGQGSKFTFSLPAMPAIGPHQSHN